MLHLSSAVFASAVVHAFYTRDAIYHHLFLAVTCLSIASHSLRPDMLLARVIYTVDRVAAHIAFAVVTCDLIVYAVLLRIYALVGIPLLVAYLWVYIRTMVEGTKRRRAHIMLHVAGCLSTHVAILLRTHG